MNGFKKLALVAIFAFSGAAFAQAIDAAGVQKLLDGFGAKFNKGDAAAMAAEYMADGKVLSQDEEPMFVGREQIQMFWGEAMKKLQNLKLTLMEHHMLAPDVLQEVGTLSAETRTQPPVKLAGKFIAVRKKVGNEWLLVNDIFNYRAVK